MELFTFSPIVFTLRLALMLSPNWFPRFMLGPIVGLLACTFLKKGIVRLRAVKFFLHFFMLNIALCSNIFCRFGTSFVVTAYFTSKATFVQMFKCFHPAGSRLGKVNQALIWESLLRRAPMMCANVYFSKRENKGIPIFKVLLKKMTTLEMFCRSSG